MHVHEGWNVRHGLCHIYMRYVYIGVVYSFCLFCCLFIIVTWWYVWCIVWASGRVGVNSIPELELQLNSYSNSGIGIEIGGIVNGIWIENSGIWIENWNWIFLQLLPQHLQVNQQFPNFSFNRGHNLPCDWLLMQQGCFKFLEHCSPVVWSLKTHGEGTLFRLSRQQSDGLEMVTINISLPPWHKTKLEVKLSQSTSFSLILLIGRYLQIYYDNPLI